MDRIRKLFPYSFRAGSGKSLLTVLAFYLLADIVCGFLIGILGKLPLLGPVFSLTGSLLALYFLVGIVLAVLYFLEILKN